MQELLGAHPLGANRSQIDFVGSLRAPHRTGGMSWTRELERLTLQASAYRRELNLQTSELRTADLELERAAQAGRVRDAARELLADEVRSLREQLAESGAPRYAEATYIAHRAKAAIAEKDARVAVLERALTAREGELAAAREALGVGDQLAREVRRTGAELVARTRELAEARTEIFRYQHELVGSLRRADQLDEALREAHARLQTQLGRSRQHAMRAVGGELRAQLRAGDPDEPAEADDKPRARTPQSAASSG
ncbi:hypothetical protein T492DRAFT_1076793 [Pavlovales sp. CCMP2436]|nr:hypothetical protein T492DRAFT_1076793 [Pavlovales sp. CCMP2436]|mmetsp:Transcript_21328/g.54085  ORF Transcript_21328/g.54085 Transcript_21328/m.54085 type:complete len:254 (+) Transcript_21328:31-792(+)